MGSGGSSSSSSSSDQSSTQLSADGVVTGKVFNVASGANSTYTDEFPQSVADVFKQLIDAATGAGELAHDAYKDALGMSSKAFETAAQPDSALVKDVSGQTPYIVIGSIAAVGIILYVILRK